MTIYQRMQRVFDAAQLPGYLQARETQSGQSGALDDIYCDYTVLSEGEALAADDGWQVWRYDVRIDLHALEDPTEAQARLLEALDEEGFEYSAVRQLAAMKGTRYRYHRRVTVVWFEYKDSTGAGGA